MKILLDTCILGELRRPQTSDSIQAALAPFDDEDLFLSVLTIGEITKGIVLLSESRKKHELTKWLNGLEHQFSDRILSLNHEIALMWGELTGRAEADGIIIPVSDGLIAATALYHGLHIMTRNLRHFKATGAFLIDPGNFSN